MKNLWIVFALVAAIIFAILAFRQCKRNKEQVADIKEISAIANDTPKYSRDKLGREHAEVKVAEADIAAIKFVYQSKVDSVLRILKIKDRQLQGLIVTGVHTSGSVETKIETVYLPSGALSRTFDYSSPYLTLHGKLDSSTVAIDYKTFDSLSFVTYYKKAGFLGLGRKEVYLNAYSQNPAAHLTGVTAIRIAQPKVKRFGVGPSVGYNYDGQQWRPSVGVTLQYSLVRF